MAIYKKVTEYLRRNSDRTFRKSELTAMALVEFGCSTETIARELRSLTSKVTGNRKYNPNIVVKFVKCQTGANEVTYQYQGAAESYDPNTVVSQTLGIPIYKEKPRQVVEVLQPRFF